MTRPATSRPVVIATNFKGEVLSCGREAIVRIQRGQRPDLVTHAHYRQRPKDDAGVEDEGVREKGIRLHIDGLIGEAGVSIFLGCPVETFEGIPGDGGDVDMRHRGHTIQVKFSRYVGPNWHFYPVAGKDFVADVGIAVNPATWNCQQVRLGGWITPEQWRDRRRLHDFGRGMGEQWVVPVSEMNPMCFLHDYFDWKDGSL